MVIDRCFLKALLQKYIHARHYNAVESSIFLCCQLDRVILMADETRRMCIFYTSIIIVPHVFSPLYGCTLRALECIDRIYIFEN